MIAKLICGLVEGTWKCFRKAWEMWSCRLLGSVREKFQLMQVVDASG